MGASKTKFLMSIAVNSDLRIHERIAKIKGKDNKISSVDEANAILAIPSKDIIITDNKDTLTYAKIDAQNYLNKQKNKKKSTIKEDNNPLKTLNYLYENYKKLKKTINDINKLTNVLQPFNVIY